jgi:hypothetical protein
LTWLKEQQEVRKTKRKIEEALFWMKLKVSSLNKYLNH